MILNSLPYIHLIEYRIGETLYCDAVRCYKKVPIFDVYFDKLNPSLVERSSPSQTVMVKSNQSCFS